MYIPEEIEKYINKEEAKKDSVGMSGASVLFFEDKVLKIQEAGEEAEREYQVLCWLEDRLPVPKVLCRVVDDGKDYLLMTKLPGKMSCEDEYLENTDMLATALAEGIHMFQKIDISDCPFSNNLDEKLRMAAYNVEHDLVDMENVNPDTFGKGGFKNPKSLLRWLKKNRPEEELVFSHGDFCLPNVFLQEGKISGFLDLGRAGVADKYQDMALCYRSLLGNLEGKYGGKSFHKVDPMILFRKLGFKADWNKVRYYILLDELF